MTRNVFCKVLGEYVSQLSDPSFVSNYKGLLRFADECKHNYRLRAPLVAYVLLTKTPQFLSKVVAVCPELRGVVSQFSEPYDKVSCYNDLYRFKGYTDLSKIKDAVNSLYESQVNYESDKESFLQLIGRDVQTLNMPLDLLANAGGITTDTLKRVLRGESQRVSLNTVVKMYQAVSNSMLGGYFD